MFCDRNDKADDGGCQRRSLAADEGAGEKAEPTPLRNEAPLSVALKAAQMMVVFLRRPGGQSQFSATLMAQISAKSPLNDLLAWLPDNIRRDLSVKVSRNVQL